jgi:YVTN family beta-propeller protein
MSHKKSVRGCVAALVFACALVGTPSIAAQADTVATTIGVVDYPNSVAINPAGTFAYVTGGSGVVSKIDLATDTVVATITGGDAIGLAINPVGTFAYVANTWAGTVSKIDLATDSVVATIAVANPYSVAINPAGTFAYVTNPDISSGGVSKINLATDTVVATITAGSQPTGLAIDSEGTFAYVANSNSGSVSKINLATDTVVATITVGSEPNFLAINPAGSFAYVVNSIGTVSKINLATDTVVTTISVGVSAKGIAINPAGTFAYVTRQEFTGTISKINLVTDTVVATISVGYQPFSVAINPAGTFAYVPSGVVDSNNNYLSARVSKIALLATDPQTITFTELSTQLTGVKTVALSAAASSNLAVAFTSATAAVCTVSGSTVTLVTPGSCTINANQNGGSGWDAATQVSRTFTILPSPPAGEVGVSIKNGDSYVNTKQVTLNLIWPEYATAARISNDGGFAASKTQTKDLAASVDWELDDTVKGIYTKVVYVRFNGVADTTKTYSDDIILDTTAPTIETSSALAASSSVDLSLKATDDITGVNKVEIRNDTKTVTKDYATKVSVPMADLALTVSSSGVRKSATTAVDIRVSDNAGNWTGWQTVTVAGLTKTPVVTTPVVTTPEVKTPVVTTPVVTTPEVKAPVVTTPEVKAPVVTTPKVKAPAVTLKKSVTAKSIAAFAKLKVLSTSKVSLKVISRYAKYCKVSGKTLRGVKAGTCKVTVRVAPKKGKASSKTVTLKVTK